MLCRAWRIGKGDARRGRRDFRHRQQLLTTRRIREGKGPQEQVFGLWARNGIHAFILGPLPAMMFDKRFGHDVEE